MNHILDIRQFKRDKDLKRVFRTADAMERLCKDGKTSEELNGKILATLFYEPSTRTRFSFESAMLRLSGSVIGTEDAAQFSSVVKGESLPDTIRVVSTFSDVIVMRHPEIGSSKLASQYSSVPVINAGDGSGQHPTQSLLDAYTIQKEIGRFDNLNVAMVGDLFYGRTVHSLTYLLAHRRGIKLFFVSPKQIALPPDLKGYLKEKGIPFEETESLEDMAGRVDVMYVTRIQKERFRNPQEYEKFKCCYVVNQNILDIMKKGARIMHPLPRVNEIAQEVDKDPRAAYFRQAENGLYIRMAVLKMVLEGFETSLEEAL